MKFPFASDNRINLLTYISLFYGLIILSGLFHIQVVRGEKYDVLADRQHWINREVKANRGLIVSSDGYVLASNKVAYFLYAEPPKVEESEKVAQVLVGIVGLERSQIFLPEDYVFNEKDEKEIRSDVEKSLSERLKADLQWVALYHDVTEEEKRSIKKENFPGLGFVEERQRYYPEGELASHALGFLGSDERGGDQGYYGIEGFYDGDLKGEEGEVAEERTAKGDPILVGGYRRVNPVDGREIHLTIDRTIQYFVEKNLKAGVEHFDAASGSVVVLEPSTGAVLAMANFPTFDPNDPFADLKEKKKEELRGKSEEQGEEEGERKAEKEDPHREKYNRRNLSIASTYEPGSVIKPLTISAAIDQGLITPETTWQDNGILTASGHRVDNWDSKHHGTITTVDILKLSNNVGSAQVGKKIGASSLYDYFQHFGVGNVTGIDLEGEDTGVLKDPSSWREIDLLTAAFGQGFSTTPLQITSFFTVFANQGILMQPHIVKAVKEGQEYREFPAEEVRRVIKKETVATMVGMLEQAVAGGESQYYNIRNYTIAGKTGTAQIAEEGKYLASKTNATFVGFLPKDPRFVMLVRLEKPTASVYAAETAVPLWMDITRELVVYFGMEPDKEVVKP